MTAQAHIFISHDFVLDAVLASVADQMQTLGHRVTRGPCAEPGKKHTLEPNRYRAVIASADVMVTTTRTILPGELLDQAPFLRGIVFPSIGTETVDLNDACERGLLVANGATLENFHSMAEATVMLILALFYRLHDSEAVLRTNAQRPTPLRASLLRGKTIGIVGYGRIGREVARRLCAFDVQLLVHDPRVDAASLPLGARSVALDELLSGSDLVTIHATPRPGGKPLVGRSELQRMRSSAYLVNTARGACVDEDALHAALRDRTIAGAALDAFMVEPLPPASPLRTLDNVLLTPHMVGHTKELFESLAPACVANVLTLLQGELPRYLCNPAAVGRWRERLSALDSQTGTRSKLQIRQAHHQLPKF